MIKKVTAFILAMSLSFSVVPAFGNITENNNTLTDEVNEIMQEYSFYNSFKGTVKEITENENGNIIVYIENEDESPANFVFTEDTYYVDGVKIEEGMEIIGFFESNKPMILIYPPQYPISIVAEVTEDLFIKADIFDSELISKDNILKLNLSEDTDIIWENNTTVNWIKQPTIEELSSVLGNRRLIVFYDITTRSIPAQTVPKKIIVLSQQIDEVISKIVINNNLINTPLPYVNEENVIMVPVRSLSQALGYDVEWNNDAKSVKIGDDVSFKIGEENYMVGKESINLESASIIKDNNTYVPLSFYYAVLNGLTVDIIDNIIMIEK